MHDELGVATVVVSNGDSRIRRSYFTAVFIHTLWPPPDDARISGSVLQDLGFPPYLNPIILSEEEGVEKPSRKIFERALSLVTNVNGGPIKLTECLHVGDELIW